MKQVRMVRPSLGRMAYLGSIAMLWLPLAASAASDVAAAWVDGASGAAALAITRDGKDISYAAAHGLRACDRVRLTDTSAVVRLVLADGGRLLLDASAPVATLPCGTPSLAAAAGRLLLALRSHADARGATVAAMSRGLPGGAVAVDDAATALRLPILFAPRAVLAVPSAGQAIHLVWQGGTAPFRLVLAQDDGKVLAEQSGITGHAGALKVAALKPGYYMLSVLNADGTAMGEEHLEIVAQEQIPAMPAALRTTALAAAARTLFYADYLVDFEDGRYALQALQMVASLQPQQTASRTWLASWGQGD